MFKKKLLRASKVTALGLALALVVLVPGAQASHWGLSGGVVTHDPTIVRESGSTWWSASTGQGIGMKFSTNNGKTWTDGLPIFAQPLSWWKNYAPNMTTNDVWAPDLEYYRGRYYCFYSVSEFGKNNSAIGLVSCSKISKGDWRDDGVVISSKAGKDSFNAIDPNLVVDANGKPWLVYGSWFDGIHIVRLNQSTMKPAGSPTKIAYKSGGIEGPCIMYNNGYYYLFTSIGKCCNGVNSTYKIMYGRSTSITGPYVDKNGKSLTSGGGTILDSGNSRWIGPGGQDVYRNSSMGYVIARHAYDASNNGTPTLLISDLYFKNGWPTY